MTAVQTAAFHVSELSGMLERVETLEGFAVAEHEVQTGKERVKLVPCRECGRPLVVNTFYAPANARCAACKGEEGGSGAAKASVANPQPGHTDPAKAVNLSQCLINPHFAFAVCPVHPDDPEHVMELKNVDHSEHYGPSEHVGFKNGRPEYRQIAPGETVLHQCAKCKATVAYSTTVQAQLRRQNEPGDYKHSNGWVDTLGAREETG